MRHLTFRALRVLAQFMVAGGFTRAIDAWVVDLDLAWQLTVLALTQLAVAFAQAYLEEQGVIPSVFMSDPDSRRGPSPNRHDAS